MPHQKIGFNTNRYLQNQAAAIKKIISQSREKLYIEFGGKIVNDKHAARVLPGYDEDTKAKLIKKLCRDGEIIFVISAKDILRKRIRGDFKITYDKESIRVIKTLREHGIIVRIAAISMLDHKPPIPPEIKNFKKRLEKLNVKTYYFYAIKDYPSIKINFADLQNNPFIKIRKKIVAILSPGGGSGKFGICLNQLYHEMKNGLSPHYLKFETFPVHDLPITHPLNLAYMAASADFYDVVMRDKRHGTATSYNRDIENYELLHLLAKKFIKEGKYLRRLNSATYMGKNKLTSGIINDELVQKEAAAEIARRLIRYKFEVAKGQEEKNVLTRCRKILSML
ncbi:MAG: DUF1846 family protein [bacterium]|nr:DUF1846 family protein [bacterium]